MNLLPLSTVHIPLVVEWLSRPENYQWFDFGNGRQILDAVTLKIMTQRDNNCLQVFTSDMDDVPIGVVGFGNIATNFRTAQLWYLLGDRGYGAQGYTAQAVSKLLQFGFAELGLESVFAWAVAQNVASVRILEKNHFQFVGRLRHSHMLNNVPVDRLYFDLLASEYQPMSDRDLASSSGTRSS